MATPPVPPECKKSPPNYPYKSTVKLIDISSEVGGKFPLAMRLESHYICDGKIRDFHKILPPQETPKGYNPATFAKYMESLAKQMKGQLARFRQTHPMTCSQLQGMNAETWKTFSVIPLGQFPTDDKTHPFLFTIRVTTETNLCHYGELDLSVNNNRHLAKWDGRQFKLLPQTAITHITVAGKELNVMDFEHPVILELNGKNESFIIAHFVMDMGVLVDGTFLYDRVGVILVPKEEASRLYPEVKRFEALQKQFKKDKEHYTGEDLKDLEAKINAGLDNLKKQTKAVTAGALVEQLEKQAQVR